MTLRNKIAALTIAAVVAAGGWTWTVGATALDGRGPSQPISEGTVTYEAPAMTRPAQAEGFPVAPLNGLNWVSRDDLTFHPVVPCRVVDTRAAVSHGRLFSQEVYSFSVVASDYSAQGGFAGSCGIPNRALAVEVNVVADSATGPGYLTLFPFGEPQPNASILNYVAGQTIANSATVGRCADSDGGLCFRDLTVYAHTSTHLLVDVLGYYEAPLSIQVDASGSVYGASLGVYYVEKFVAPAGTYGVHFFRDVEDCVFTATPGWGDGLTTGPVFIEVDDIAGTVIPDGVYVYMRNSSGAPADYPFQLVVHC